MKTLLIAILALAGLAHPVAAADLAVRPSPVPAGSTAVPACDDPSVLGRIVERQHWATRHTWNDGLLIEGIANVRQTYRQTRFVSAIEHRHCSATVDLGRAGRSRLYYMISAELGFASIGWGVDFCLPRQDYYRVYNNNCSVLR